MQSANLRKSLAHLISQNVRNYFPTLLQAEVKDMENAHGWLAEMQSRVGELHEKGDLPDALDEKHVECFQGKEVARKKSGEPSRNTQTHNQLPF